MLAFFFFFFCCAIWDITLPCISRKGHGRRSLPSCCSKPLIGNVEFTHTIHIPVMMKTGRLRGRMDHRDMVGGWRSPLQRATTSPGSYAKLLESSTTLRWWCVNLWLFMVTLHCVPQLWHHTARMAEADRPPHLTAVLSCPLVAGCNVKPLTVF